MNPLRLTIACALTTAALAAVPVSGAAGEGEGVAAEPPAFVPGELIVRFAASSEADDRAAALARAQGDVTQRLGPARMRLVELGGPGVRVAARELEGDPAVRYAEPNYLRDLEAIPNDPLFDRLWGLQNTGQTVNGTTGVADADIDAAEAWDLERGDPSTVVAIIDSGVDPSHPDLAGQLWSNPGETPGNGLDDDANGFADDTGGWDFYDDDSDPRDGQGHGTHVAGTVLARGDNGVGVTGVAQQGSLMRLRVCGSYEGDGCPDSALIDAITYAGEMGADVANGSLGGPGASLAIADAIDAQPQTLFVWAAGNGGADGIGDDNDILRQDPCQSDQSPGFDAGNSICVAATNRSDNLAGFSNYGAAGVDLAAPGTTILSTSALRKFFTDDFETLDFATRWQNEAGDTWARTSEAPLSSFGITDSPGGNYAPSSVNAVRSQEITLPPGYGDCALSYFRSIQLAAGDRFEIQVYRNGILDADSSASLTSASNGAGNSFIELDHDFDAGAQVVIRLVLVADATAQANGVHMDNIALQCAGAPSDGGYVYLQGTSMATPHVAGAAALLASRDPGASPQHLRSALLESVDPLPSLAGKTATGGRLNARSALELIEPVTETPPETVPPPEPPAVDGAAPQTTIDRRPAKRSTKRRVTFAFSSSEPGSTFACKLNGTRYRPCSSPLRVRARKGRNAFAVRARDAAGNQDPTPATVRFKVKRRR